MTADFYYVTHRKDLAWISYSMQLLHKHFRGAFGVIVIADPDCEEVCSTWRLPRTKYVYAKPWPDGYSYKMYQVLMADQYSQADLIMLIDSDHILMEPFYFEDLLDKAGNPIIRYRRWDEDPNDTGLTVGLKVWGPPVERTLGVKLDHEYMIAPPFTFHRDTFPKVRTRVEQITGLPFERAVYSDVPFEYKKFLSHPKPFCDYEALGVYAAKFQPGRYSLQHYPRGQYWPFRVYWSHEDWNANLQARLDALLKT